MAWYPVAATAHVEIRFCCPSSSPLRWAAVWSTALKGQVSCRHQMLHHCLLMCAQCKCWEILKECMVAGNSARLSSPQMLWPAHVPSPAAPHWSRWSCLATGARTHICKVRFKSPAQNSLGRRVGWSAAYSTITCECGQMITYHFVEVGGSFKTALQFIGNQPTRIHTERCVCRGETELC